MPTPQALAPTRNGNAPILNNSNTGGESARAGGKGVHPEKYDKFGKMCIFERFGPIIDRFGTFEHPDCWCETIAAWVVVETAETSL